MIMIRALFDRLLGVHCAVCDRTWGRAMGFKCPGAGGEWHDFVPHFEDWKPTAQDIHDALVHTYLKSTAPNWLKYVEDDSGVCSDFD